MAHRVRVVSPLRRVVDFGDPDKIEAVLAGGVSERLFQPHQNDQAKLWAANQRRPWWFNPAQAEAHGRSRVVRTP
ncbi:MAG: penicillin acylase family protein [Betaproteobacteria bacterium]|nr:penicillin acylase family protein [Betaproteobacteria bacterium]